MDATGIWRDNHSCIKLSKNPVFHDKSKNIDVKYHYIRDMVERGAVKLQYQATQANNFVENMHEIHEEVKKSTLR